MPEIHVYNDIYSFQKQELGIMTPWQAAVIRAELSDFEKDINQEAENAIKMYCYEYGYNTAKAEEKVNTEYKQPASMVKNTVEKLLSGEIAEKEARAALSSPDITMYGHGIEELPQLETYLTQAIQPLQKPLSEVRTDLVKAMDLAEREEQKAAVSYAKDYMDGKEDPIDFRIMRQQTDRISETLKTAHAIQQAIDEGRFDANGVSFADIVKRGESLLQECHADLEMDKAYSREWLEELGGKIPERITYNAYERNNPGIIKGNPDNIDLSQNYIVFRDGDVCTVDGHGDGDMVDVQFGDRGATMQLNTKMIYDKGTYDKLMQISAQNTHDTPTNQKPGDWMHGPSHDRGFYKGQPNLHIEGFGMAPLVNDNGNIIDIRRAREQLTIENAFGEDGKLTPEAQKQFDNFVKNFCEKYRGGGERNIIAMDNRYAVKVVDLSEQALSMMEHGAGPEEIAEQVCRDALSSEYLSHMYAGNTYTIEDDTGFLTEASHKTAIDFDLRELAESTEHCLDVLAVCEPYMDMVPDYVKEQIEEVSRAVSGIMEAHPLIKEGFSLNPTVSSMTPEEKLDAAVLGMMGFMSSMDLTEGRGASKFSVQNIGPAAAATTFLECSQNIETVIQNLKESRDLTPEQERKIRAAQEISKGYAQELRLECDRYAEGLCGSYDFDLPKGECGIHVDGLPDTISTEDERIAFEASMQCRGYGSIEWTNVYLGRDEKQIAAEMSTVYGRANNILKSEVSLDAEEHPVLSDRASAALIGISRDANMIVNCAACSIQFSQEFSDSMNKAAATLSCLADAAETRTKVQTEMQNNIEEGQLYNHKESQDAIKAVSVICAVMEKFENDPQFGVFEMEEPELQNEKEEEVEAPKTEVSDINMDELQGTDQTDDDEIGDMI